MPRGQSNRPESRSGIDSGLVHPRTSPWPACGVVHARRKSGFPLARFNGRARIRDQWPVQLRAVSRRTGGPLAQNSWRSGEGGRRDRSQSHRPVVLGRREADVPVGPAGKPGHRRTQCGAKAMYGRIPLDFCAVIAITDSRGEARLKFRETPQRSTIWIRITSLAGDSWC